MTETLDSPVTPQLDALRVNYEPIEITFNPDKNWSGLWNNCLKDKIGIPAKLCAACCFGSVPAASCK